MSEVITKLALINSLVHLLAEVDLEIVDGAESRLEMESGEVFTISFNRESRGEDTDAIEIDGPTLDDR